MFCAFIWAKLTGVELLAGGEQAMSPEGLKALFASFGIALFLTVIGMPLYKKYVRRHGPKGMQHDDRTTKK